MSTILDQVRPRLRGSVHKYAAMVAVPFFIALCVAAAVYCSVGETLAVIVYSLTVIGVFTASSIYHTTNWQSPSTRDIARRVDHSMIFALIAGTYTAIFALGAPNVATLVLSLIWAGAIAGIVFKVAWIGAPRAVGVALYLLLSWVSVAALPIMWRDMGPLIVGLVLAGGLAYTLGGITYGFKWPRFAPKTFGFHEAFHSATVVAAIFFYAAVWVLVLR